MDQGNNPVISKPITSAKSASDLADMLIAPPESKEGDLLRNKGSDIDLNALYQQSQQQQQLGYGIGMRMPMMSPGTGYTAPSTNNIADTKMFHIGSPQNNGFAANGIFSQPNVVPTRSAPRPPQFNAQQATSHPVIPDNIQQPNVNQLSSGMFPQKFLRHLRV